MDNRDVVLSRGYALKNSRAYDGGLKKGRRIITHSLVGLFYSFCVASLTGRWSIGCLVTALRELRPLVPCYARSRPVGTGLIAV